MRDATIIAGRWLCVAGRKVICMKVLALPGLYRTTSNEPSANRGLDAEKPAPFLDPPKRTDPWTAPPDRDVGATGGTFRKSC